MVGVRVGAHEQLARCRVAVLHHQLVADAVSYFVQLQTLLQGELAHERVKRADALVRCGRGVVEDEREALAVPHRPAAHALERLDGEGRRSVRTHGAVYLGHHDVAGA